MRKKEKIYIISMVLLDNKSIQLTYLLDLLLKNEIYKGYFIKSCVLEDLSLFEKIKIGKWKKVDLDNVGNIMHLYN